MADQQPIDQHTTDQPPRSGPVTARPVFDAPLPPLPPLSAAPTVTGPPGWIAPPGAAPPPSSPPPSAPPSSAPPPSSPPSSAPPGAVDPLDQVGVPPRLAAAARQSGAATRAALLGGAGGDLWVAAAIAVGVVSVLQALLVLLLAPDALPDVASNPVRAVIATLAVAAPTAVHAAIEQGSDGVRWTSHVPPTLFTALLLGTFGRLLRSRWRRTPPATLRTAGAEVLRAAGALAGVIVAAALLSSVVGGVLGGDGPQLRAQVWSSAGWGLLAGLLTAAVALGPALPARHPGDRPLLREAAAVVRGTLSGTVGLLALAFLLVVVISIREAVLADGRGIAEGTAAVLLMLPTILVVVAGLALGAPAVIDAGGVPALGVDGPLVRVGLTGVEGVGGLSGAVPMWLWLIVPLAVVPLVLAGTGATWRAAAAGVRATRVGLAVGPAMALLWVPMALLASARISIEDGVAVGTLLQAMGLDGVLGAAGPVRVGLSAGVLAAVLLVLGTLAGWCGALLARPLRQRAPSWVVRTLAGRPLPPVVPSGDRVQ